MPSRRFLGLAALSAAALAIVSPAAGAQEAAPTESETVSTQYAAQASGRALLLSVFGQELTIGQTLAGLDSSVSAQSTGSGVATPAFEAGVTTADVSSEGTAGSPDETCEFDLQDIPGLGISMACSSSTAAITGGFPTSSATGRVGTATISPIAPLLDTPLAEVVTQVDGGVEQLLEGLAPLTTGIDDATGLGVEDTLDDLFGALFDGADLVTLDIGATTSSVVSDDATTTASCVSEGGRIDVLDMPAIEAAGEEAVDAPPVLSIILGASGSSVKVDNLTSTATPEVNPSLVTVVVPSLGIDQPVAVGQTIEIPLPEPIGTSIIQVADGTTGVDENGNTFATANSVLLDLLNGEALQGGVELALASCTASAQAATTITAVTTTIPEAPVPTLPRTGGGAPGGLVAIASVAAAGFALRFLRRDEVA